MKKHHTVVIVGGGPSGSSAAYTLAKQGVDVCVVDKAVFPRDKLCAGLLSLRSKQLFSEIFDASWEEAFEYKASGVKFFHKNKLLNDVKGCSEMFFTYRVDFDDYLLTMAKSVGVSLYLGSGISSVDMDNRVCQLRSGGEISYDYLIGADGVNSIVAKTIYGKSFDKEKIAFALEIEVDRSLSEREVNVPELYFGVAKWGYGWVFPKEKALTVGIIGLHVKNPDLKKEFYAFLIDLFGRVPDLKINGHYIPFGNYRKTPGVDNVLLVGDAAGVVDPITGEGIAYAMQTGYFAALAIIESENAEKNTDVIKAYKKRYSEITSALNYANKLRYLIFPRISQSLFVKVFPATTQLPLMHMNLVAGKIDYKEYSRYLISRVFKVIIKRILFVK